MKRELGTGIDGLKAVLGSAISWSPNSDDVAEVTRAELCDAAVAWSGLPLREIEAALDLLILTPAQLRDEGPRYWEQERRRYRLTTHPLISASERWCLASSTRSCAAPEHEADERRSFLAVALIAFSPREGPRGA